MDLLQPYHDQTRYYSVIVESLEQVSFAPLEAGEAFGRGDFGVSLADAVHLNSNSKTRASLLRSARA